MSEQADQSPLSDDIAAKAIGYTKVDVVYRWIEAGVLVEWADRAAELEAELAVQERIVRTAAFAITQIARWPNDSVADSIQHYIRIWSEIAREELAEQETEDE